MNKDALPTKKNSGVSLIIVILVMAFMLTIGLFLMTITSTGPGVAGNMRLQEQAFNAAEAGFDAAWRYLNSSIGAGGITDFSPLYRTTYNGSPGLDNPDPLNPYYFRKLTDQQLWNDVVAHPDNSNPSISAFYLNFTAQPMPDDSRYSYTCFLINDEAGGMTLDNADSILVCIGRGPRNTYSRLEVVIQIQSHL
jgi:hypothetical protein